MKRVIAVSLATGIGLAEHRHEGRKGQFADITIYGLVENLSHQANARALPWTRWGQRPQTRIPERIAKAPPWLGSRGETPGLNDDSAPRFPETVKMTHLFLNKL